MAFLAPSFLYCRWFSTIFKNNFKASS
ncbi:hypothetical protein CY0110_17257 [Crocosphaera chwakensis CCY0110]|uniref:Uncharacterized protein n=1 Tax=Crocosphaera chwakensis CCY0110 TaxID=391612 RepID=A3IID3_9CHRO|nr:hypothetical protein CY0110_17257 [Crocosphaera chwakensis CCY0110]